MAESTTMTAVSPPTLPSDASPTAITTDFLALVGFAARLGACVNNDAGTSDGSDPKSVRDEAMLLMSLLMGDKAHDILSEEIGAKESRCESKRSKCMRPQDMDMGNFSFTFPSLSLQPDEPEVSASAEETTKAAGAPSEIGDDGEGKEDDEDQPPPSALLGRTRCVRDKDGIRDSSESMAHNVLESFGAALVWRAKTWVKSLANVLALKEQKKIDALKAKGEEGSQGQENDDQEGADDPPESENNDDLMNSKEMQIIDAIVKSSEEVSVVNIKTAFRVLPNRVSRQNGGNALLITQESPEPSPKKSKTVSPQDTNNEYRVTHKLMFEATISMTSNDGVRYNGIKLQAPGYIQGTFAKISKNASSEEGGEEETLLGVSMTLDTDALALSLERQSRLVVRRAAEAAIMAASGIDCSSSPTYMDSPHVHHSVISPRYVLMSPVPMYPTTENEDPGDLPSVPPMNALGEGGSKSSSRCVSASEAGCSSDSSANTTPSISPVKKPYGGKNGTGAPQSPSFPALLSVANKELSGGGEP